MKLAECNFSDVYVSDARDDIPVIRSLTHRGGEDGAWIRYPDVVEVPRPLLKDLGTLFLKVLEESAKGKRDEVVVVHERMRYRCARIIAPEGIAIRKTEEPQVWCLRRISDFVRPFEDLGFGNYTKKVLHGMGRARGLLLVCGSFGSGKTTTASSIFDHWVTVNREVGVTLEDPPEVMLARMGSTGTIFQIDLSENSVEEAIKKLRRWAARYVFLGEIRTGEAAQELLQISQSGPMTLATLHASEPVSAITALVRFAAARMSENDARDLIARTVRGVVYQTLENGVFDYRYLSVGEKEDFGVRTKIRIGDFQRIEESLEYQEKNRPT